MQNVKKEMGKGTNAQLQRASDGYPFQFPHFTDTVWIKHPNPAHLTYDQMEEYAYKFVESEIVTQPIQKVAQDEHTESLETCLDWLLSDADSGKMEEEKTFLMDAAQHYFASEDFTKQGPEVRLYDIRHYNKILQRYAFFIESLLTVPRYLPFLVGKKEVENVA